MSQPVSITSRLRALVLPARPDPARSRRIAEVRLVISAVAVLAVFAAIAARGGFGTGRPVGWRRVYRIGQCGLC